MSSDRRIWRSAEECKWLYVWICVNLSIMFFISADHSKVDNVNLGICMVFIDANEHIGGFDISMDESFFMDAFERV